MHRLVIAPLAVALGCAPSPRAVPAPHAIASTAPPSCDAPAFRDMDFWLGDWDATIRARAPSGTGEWREARGENHVRAALDRCVIEESFHADGPDQPWNGRSFSTYSARDGAWRQTWVDDSGSYLAFRGGKEGDAFVLYGEPHEANGQTRRMRMVFRVVGRDALFWAWEAKIGEGPWSPAMEIRYVRQARPVDARSCDADPRYHDLDFWLGDWTVAEGKEPAGTNRIEKILGGCAVVERWRAVDGSEGQSLFFHPPGGLDWKQVWVTDRGRAPLGVKEKRLVARLPDGGVRFQGEIPGPAGRTILDRTTLTKLDGGRVRQVIETSIDGGATFRVGFDAVYTRSPST